VPCLAALSDLLPDCRPGLKRVRGNLPPAMLKQVLRKKQDDLLKCYLRIAILLFLSIFEGWFHN